MSSRSRLIKSLRIFPRGKACVGTNSSRTWRLLKASQHLSGLSLNPTSAGVENSLLNRFSTLHVLDTQSNTPMALYWKGIRPSLSLWKFGRIIFNGTCCWALLARGRHMAQNSGIRPESDYTPFMPCRMSRHSFAERVQMVPGSKLPCQWPEKGALILGDRKDFMHVKCDPKTIPKCVHTRLVDTRPRTSRDWSAAGSRYCRCEYLFN